MDTCSDYLKGNTIHRCVHFFFLQLVCCTSICLVREWSVGFFANAMHPCLLHMMDVRPSCTYLTSSKNCFIQTVSFVQWLVAIYYVSIVENAMVGSFLHFHLMTPTLIKKNIPHGGGRSFPSPVQHTLQNPLDAISLHPRHN